MSERDDWLEPRIVASVWWCGDDDHCDCTQPLVERITPNIEAGHPWIHRERLWSGRFLTDTRDYSAEEREALQYAPLREACAGFGVPVPDEAEGVAPIAD